MQEFLNALYPILLLSITGLLGYITKALGPKIVDLIILKIGLAKYEKYGVYGQDAWDRVEEYFRLNPVIGDTIQAKITMFRSEIKRKIPGITDIVIEDIRQSIAGVINSEKPSTLKIPTEN